MILLVVATLAMSSPVDAWFPPLGTEYPPDKITEYDAGDCGVPKYDLKKVREWYNDRATDTFVFWLDRINNGDTSKLFFIELVLWRQEFLLWVMDYLKHEKGCLYSLEPPDLMEPL